MRKVLGLAIVFISILGTTYGQEIWVSKDGSIRNIDTRAMLISGEDVYLATKNEIYKANDTREKWLTVFSLPSGENEISSLAGSPGNIFAGTRRGLYRSQDHGKSWRDIFRTILPGKNNILCVDVSRHNPLRVLAGTERGLFLSEDAGEHWNDISGVLKNRRIAAIALNKTALYAGTDGGLYIKRNEVSDWDRIYVRSAVTEKNDDKETNDFAEVDHDNGIEAGCIALKDARIYVGSGKRIMLSDDEGKTWNAFPCDGLSGTLIYIVTSAKSDKLYAATTKGIFEFANEKAQWFELYKGTSRVWNVNKLIFDGPDEKYLWALTDKGLYRLENGRYGGDNYVDIEMGLKSFKIMAGSEPSYRELQQAALKFNEVGPEKIRRWRNESRAKALFPKVSIGMDNNRSSNTEIYTSATRDYAAVGPEDFASGFDMSVSWDIGGLIWSDDQTNIDVRSRLNTQLRNDILDDLRRAYYERKRLQFELMTNPPQDTKARFDKEMRIQELAQAIDDLTGNYLSDHMRKH